MNPTDISPKRRKYRAARRRKDPKRTLNCSSDLSRLEGLRGHTKQALDYATEALQLMRRLKGPDDPEVGAILADMSNVMLWADDLEGAERAATGSGQALSGGSGSSPGPRDGGLLSWPISSSIGGRSMKRLHCSSAPSPRSDDSTDPSAVLSRIPSHRWRKCDLHKRISWTLRSWSLKLWTPTAIPRAPPT